MPGRCVVGGCSAFADVQKGIMLHAIPYYNDIRPEAAKQRKKWVDFVKRKRAKWELTRHSSICYQHFKKDDFIRQFIFVDKVTNKPIAPRLKRDSLGVNVVPTVHAKAMTRSPVVSESAKRCHERGVRNVTIFFI